MNQVSSSSSMQFPASSAQTAHRIAHVHRGSQSRHPDRDFTASSYKIVVDLHLEDSPLAVKREYEIYFVLRSHFVQV